MGRKPNIWLRKQNKTWYVKLRGKQVNLGKDKKVLERGFHQSIADHQDQTVSLQVEATIFYLNWTWSDTRPALSIDQDHSSNVRW